LGTIESDFKQEIGGNALLGSRKSKNWETDTDIDFTILEPLIAILQGN